MSYAAQQKWREANPLKRWSHVAVASALRRGLLIRPDACEECGKEGPVDAHHDDHRQPLAVRWLCRACHVHYHAQARRKGGPGDA